MLCVKCEEIKIPSEIFEKVTLVNGKALDLCDKADGVEGDPAFVPMDHYLRASMTHAAAIADAAAHGKGGAG